MQPMYSIDIKEKAIVLRERGYSIKEVANKLGIAQGTSSVWLKEVKLDDKAIQRLMKRKIYGQYKSRETAKQKKAKKLKKIRRETEERLKNSQIDKTMQLLLCSFLFWAEGSKDTSLVRFTNSDPTMVATFMKLLRNSFNLDESKFRVLVHIHDYHDEKEILKYWSKITGINLSQFNKSYRKPHTQKRKKSGYKGCAAIKYYDHKIALRLYSFYNTFAQEFIGM